MKEEKHMKLFAKMSAVLLVVFLILSCFPVASFAENGTMQPVSNLSRGNLLLQNNSQSAASANATDFTLNAFSNDTSWGTVSVQGTTVAAFPCSGCQLSGCEIVSGTADYTIDGTTIQVSPSSDCLIRVNFAPSTALPSRYDGREQGYMTPVKNQGSYGTCWCFGTIVPLEAYMIKHGILDNTTGRPATTSIDLSESQLAWFNYTAAYDRLGMLTGDSSNPSANYLNQGGTSVMTTYTLMRGVGPASESVSALRYGVAPKSGLASQYAYNYNVANVTDVKWIPGSNLEAVKRAIMEYGAGSISYFQAGDYINTTTFAFYSDAFDHANHLVAVVGWDDNYSRDNFVSAHKPAHNGAWILKNSWGPAFGDQGYFYLSYEDTVVYNEDFFFYQVENLDTATKCYQYDGTSNNVSYQAMGNQSQVANVFTARETELLQAVALATMDEDTTYTLSIYRNPTSSSDPTSGTLAYTQTGFLAFGGYRRILLDSPVALGAGNRFSVVFTLNTPASADDGKYIHIPYDASATETEEPYVDNPCTWVHVNHGDTSFYREANGAWQDCPNYGDFRIKAYTGERTFVVNAVPNNAAWGTVTVRNSTISAFPAQGYYVSGCEVVSGSADYTIDGNSIYVAPSSDCTLRVLFAQKPQLTVNYNVCGLIADSRIAYPNDSISLPAAVSQTPEGWTFCGWMEQELEETDTKPSFLEPGASYVVRGNTTLYALFSRIEGLGGTGYQLLTAAPDTWEGKYVITYTANAGTMRVLKGISTTSVTAMTQANSEVAFYNTGITLNQNVLMDVNPAYQFTVFTHNDVYWIQNVSTGSYLGGTTVLYATTQTYSSFLPWTLSFNGGAAHLKNHYKGNDLSYSSGFMLGSSNSNICLWKEASVGTTYYATVFAEHVHELTYTAALAPTCTEAGHLAYYACAGCGRFFTDAEAETEITLAETVLPALGHNAGAAVTENQVAPTCGTVGSYDVVTYCLRCSAEVSRQHNTVAATGNHSYGVWSANGNGTHARTCAVCGNVDAVACSYNVVVTAPTTTEQGYTTHTCTVCGYSFVDNYTAPLGTDYLITFSVPNSVAPVASMSCHSGDAITLPTAGAPAGYTFLGWVYEDVDGTTMPALVLNGSYVVRGDVTLKALYSHVVSTGTAYERVTSNLADWSGNYVITYGVGSTPYALKGLTGNTSYQNVSSNGTVALANTGMTYANGRITGATSPYIFQIAPKGSYYTIQNTSTGTYVGSYSRALYSRTSYSLLYCRWSFTCNNGNMIPRNTMYPLYSYMNFSSSNTFMMSGSSTNGINFWKETNVGYTAYTTK